MKVRNDFDFIVSFFSCSIDDASVCKFEKIEPIIEEEGATEGVHPPLRIRHREGLTHAQNLAVA